MPTLHLICGLPGAGKSTLARALEQAGQGLRLTTDEWLLALGSHLYHHAMRERVEQLQWTLAQRLLKLGTSVILENGFWSRDERDRYRADAAACGADTRLHYLDVEVGELRRRIVLRNAHLPPAAVIDPDDLTGWATMFEAPTDEECFGFRIG